MSSRWDRILSSSPINRTTAAVTSRSDTSLPQGPVIDSRRSHWSEPQPTIPVDTASGAVDIAGSRVGRLVAVGYLGKLGAQRTGRWLVRCDCGQYEARTRRALSDATRHSNDMCVVCRQAAYDRSLYADDGRRGGGA